MATNIPNDATVFPPSLGPWADYQPLILQSTQTQVDTRNKQQADNYALACTTWTADNTQHRDYNLPLTPKPLAPLKQVMHLVTVEDGASQFQLVDTATGQAIGGPFTAVVGTDYLWITEDGDPVGPPCPDLPVVLPSIPGHVHVGRNIGGAYYVKCSDDTYPMSGPPVPATADDGTKGMFAPLQSEFVNMGWYVKVG